MLYTVVCVHGVSIPFCSEWYESDAVMVSEEGQVMTGLLMGLNAIDYNMTLPGESFDRSVSV